MHSRFSPKQLFITFFMAWLFVSFTPAVQAEVSTQSAYAGRMEQTKEEHASVEKNASPNGGLSESLGMVTGSRTGTYFRFGQDISEALKKYQITVDVKESVGSIDNITRIGSSENAAFGIVQSDVLGFLTRSKEPESKKMAENLRMVFPFYQEEVHLIAGKNITSLKELAGKTVALGETGSGSWLTAMNLFQIEKITPKAMLRLSPEEGLVAVLRGKADAMLFVAGKPVKLFENLSRLSDHEQYANLLKNIHFIPINSPAILKEYSKANITPKDYPFVSKDVPTIAVTALLVSYNFSGQEGPYAAARCETMRKFSTALHQQLKDLKEHAHPKWKEVNLDTEIPIWQRDSCTVQDVAGAKLENELLRMLGTDAPKQ